MSTSLPSSTSARQASCSAADAPAVTTMRRAGTSSPKRSPYQREIASRSSGSPTAAVYCVSPAAMQRCAASTTAGTAVKSGSPMLRKIIGRPPRAGSQAGDSASCCAALAHSIT